MKEVLIRMGGFKQAKEECMDRERWRLSCCGHPLGGIRGKEASETIEEKKE